MLRNQYQLRTHCHVYGTSQSGKSKFCEYCIRAHIRSLDGVCVLDWHGTLYWAVLNYLAYLQPDCPIVLLNSSSGTFIQPFKPFTLRQGENVSAYINRMATLIVKPWGEVDTNKLPTYERIVKMLLAFMAYTGEPLNHAAKLLDFHRRAFRDYAISQIKDDYWKSQWQTLQCITTVKEWNVNVQSTQNRLGRFLSSEAVLRFMCCNLPGISIADCIRQKAIVLVNLAESPQLDQESARVFASMLLSEFLLAAKGNMHDPMPYYLYCDEAQNYLTNDAAEMLDQALKSGLRLTLIHHDMGQFDGE